MSRSATLEVQQPQPLRDRVLVAWAACGVLLPCLVPQLGPMILALSVVAPVLLADRAVLMRNIRQVGPVTAVLAAIVFYLCLNVLFAIVTDNAAGAIVTIALGGLACHICGAAFPGMQARDLTLMARGLMIGGVLVAAFLFVEYASRMSLLRAVQHAAEAAQLRFVRIDAGTWARPTYTHMSRNLVLLIMLVWATVAFVRGTAAPTRRQAVTAAVLFMVFSAAFLSVSATAKAGLIAGGVAWLLTRHASRLAAGVLYAGWLTASLAAIPAAQLIHRLRLYDVDWIGSSLRHRLMIWSASSEWFWQHPMIGVGVGGARKLNLNDGLHISARGIEGEPLNWHAHNIFVQCWFEAGAIGGLLLCLFGVLLLRAIFRLPDAVRPFAVATFVSIFFIGLTGFSLWASWYLAGYGMAALCILMTVFMNRDAAPLRGSAGG